MKLYRYISFVLALLLINLELAGAASVLGKIAVYTSPTSKSPEIVPLVSGEKTTYSYPSLIKISGATLIADKGTVLEALDKGETIDFQLERGRINFKLAPHKVHISFTTILGQISSPRVIRASNSTITGGLKVMDKYAVLEVTEGSLNVTSSGSYSVVKINGNAMGAISKERVKIEAGEKIILAQANLAQQELTRKFIDLLVGKTGTAVTALSPEGVIEIGGEVLKAEVVDDKLKLVKDADVPEGRQVKVVGLRRGSIIALVQPLQLLPQDDTTNEGRAVAAAYGSFLLWLAILCGSQEVCDDEDGDGEASPIVE